MSRRASWAPSLLLALLAAAPAWAQGEADLKNAKTLFFDRKYAEAREAWQAIRAGGGPDAEPATYWVARCSESLGETDRALKEYGEYLERRPADRTLAEEARTSRVGLAARLYKAGKKQHLPVLQDALKDPSKTVRYFAAFQQAGLGPPAGLLAVPTLCRIVSDEKDADLVDRAKVYLLRLDPKCLTPEEPAPRTTPRPAGSAPRVATWLKIRIYEKGGAKPNVSVNLPVGLAEMAFKSLPDDARSELKKKGYDADNFWERLKKLGPTEIVSIVGDDGEKIQIWIE